MQTKNAKSGGGNKFTAFLKRNIYYILMILCVLAIGSMITVAAVLNNAGGDTDVVVPPNEPEKPVDNTPKPKEFILSMPVNGEVILTFGANYTSGKNQNKLHEAIDIAGTAGTNVIAPFDGKVTSIDKNNVEFKGVVVTIDHGNGYISTISLLDSVAVSLNQQLTSGTVIGKVASGDKSFFESALKEHIHYELSKDGKKVDPMQYMADGNK